MAMVTAMTEQGWRWFVAQTQPRAEDYARRQLGAQGFRVFLPRYLKDRTHARRVERVPYPLYPRYLFVQINTTVQRWRSINGTIGVSHLIGTSDGPTPVAGGVVEELMRRQDAAGFIKLAKEPRFTVGDPVRILGGAFASALGLFEGLADRDRVAILVDLLGRKVRVTLDESRVEKAA
jgi:transcriptional antiterminator RfaH